MSYADYSRSAIWESAEWQYRDAASDTVDVTRRIKAGCITSGMLCTAIAIAMIGPILVKDEKATYTASHADDDLLLMQVYT